MANRRPLQNSGRRMDFGRNDRGKSFGRGGVSPWQGGGGPGGGMSNLLPISGGPTEATLALASNLINLLQPRQNAVPSLLDMPIRRDFDPDLGRFDRGFGPNRMGNQGNFRRTGNYNRAGERINNNRKPFRPHDNQRQPNRSAPRKDSDSKAKPVKESEEKKDGETQEGTENKQEAEKETPKTRYDDIASSLLRCHICNKTMWDGRSFENHLSGRAHAIMLRKTAESYALTADTMRQEFKIREMKRTRKTGGQPARDFYCAMCDLYAADGAAHRTTVGHRKLKKYLHPNCVACHKEMPTRLDLDEHRLSAEHMRNMQDKQDVHDNRPKPEVMAISTLSMELTYVREDKQYPPKDRNKPTEGETQNGEVKEEPEESEEKKEIDKDNTVLDIKEDDDLSSITQDMLPAYSTERGVGRSFLSDFHCVQCRLCKKLLDSQETAEVHLKTWRHHQLFLKHINEKSQHLQAQKKQGEDAAVGNKRPHNDDNDGDWKRRKTAEVGENGEEVKEEPQSEAEQDGEETSNGEPLTWDQDEQNNDEQQETSNEADATMTLDQQEEAPEQSEQPEEEEPAEEEAVPPTPVRAQRAIRGSPRARARGRGRRY